MTELNIEKLFKDRNWSWINENHFSDDKLPIPIPNGLYLLWSVLWPINEQFDLDTISGRVGLISWWLLWGRYDFTGIDIDVCDIDTLVKYSDIKLPQDVVIPFTAAMIICWQSREDLRKAFDLSVREGRLGYMLWWINEGYKSIAPHTLPEVQQEALFEPSSEVVQDVGVPITGAMFLFWQYRKDILQEFNHTLADGRRRFLQWWGHSGKQEAGVLADIDKLFTEYRLRPEVVFKETEASEDNQSAGSYGTLKSGGINLIGLAKGELGIGEDLRMASRAMSSAGVDFSVFNFPPSCSSREEDTSVAHLISDELVYNVNMVNLTGFEHSRLLTQMGRGVFDKRYTIGAWPWELPLWPRPSDIVFKLVDEIWASTKYTVQAYSNSPKPVIHMPMAVDFDSVPSFNRADFGLPDDVYLFIFVFDGLSYMARKNPIAHINAFWKAFPKERKDVGLVIKTMNAQVDNDIWWEFHKMVSKDDRIHVFVETFPKEKVLGLMNCCDAFLSLHRAEGFGRCIAEMMWLGKPVIVTNYSGNTDFTTSDTAFLVDGSLVPVGRNEYIFGEGQLWCDPDVDQAAHHMFKCVEDKDLARKISIAGKNFIRTNYSSKAVGVKYMERLKELGLIKYLL